MRGKIISCIILVLSFLNSQAASVGYLELVDSADYYIAKELWNKAEVKILEALRLEPANFHNSLLLSNLGIIQTQKEEYDKAIDSFSLALSLAPSSTVIYNNRARTFLIKDNINNAIEDLEESLALDSIQEWPLETLGYIYLQKNQIDLAKILFNRLKENFPENSLAYSGLANVFAMEGNADLSSEYFRKSLELNPKDEETLTHYISLLIETEKYTEARSEIRKALEINSNNPMFYLLRGYLHRLNYRLEEAQADKKTAIDKGLDPTYASQFIP